MHCGFRAAELTNPWADLETNITREAIVCLEKAIGALGDRPTQGGFRDKRNSDIIKEVIRLLLRAPSAKNAADAFIMMGQVADSCDTEAEGNVKATQRVVADVVVLRCRSVSEPGNRQAFILAAEEAFGRGGEPHRP